MRNIMAAVFFLVVVPTAAVAQDAQPDSNKAPSDQIEQIPQSTQAASDDGDRQVCEVTRQLGSNLTKRVCMTARQRDLNRERARAELSKAQSH